MKQHDHLFREMVADPAAREHMVRLCLPDLADQLDLNTLTMVDATFTNGKQADLLVSMRYHRDPNRIAHVLVEHKSYHDRSVMLQLLGYTVELWNKLGQAVPAEDQGLRPEIHLVVFYHGKTRWTAPRELGGLYATTAPGGENPDSGHQHTISVPYRLVDLNTIEPALVAAPDPRVRAFLTTFQYVFRTLSPAMAETVLDAVMAPGLEPGVTRRLMDYLFHNTGKDNVDTILTELEKRRYTVEGGAIMTMAQELIRRGTEKGIEKGIKKGIAQVARKMLETGLSLNTIEETTGLTKEQIAALKNGNGQNEQ